MSIAKLYKATLPSVNYVFKNGKPAIFVQGRFATEVQAEIEELDAEVAASHPHIYVDAAEKEIDSAAISPIDALTAKIRAQLIAEMEAATAVNNDMGSYEAGKVIPANSLDVASATAGGSGVGLAARLMNITGADKTE